MASPEENDVKTCPNCGETVPRQEKQCPTCGQLLGGSSGRKRQWWKSLTPTEIFLLVLGSIMLSVFLVAL